MAPLAPSFMADENSLAPLVAATLRVGERALPPSACRNVRFPLAVRLLRRWRAAVPFAGGRGVSDAPASMLPACPAELNGRKVRRFISSISTIVVTRSSEALEVRLPPQQDAAAAPEEVVLVHRLSPWLMLL